MSKAERMLDLLNKQKEQRYIINKADFCKIPFLALYSLEQLTDDLALYCMADEFIEKPLDYSEKSRADNQLQAQKLMFQEIFDNHIAAGTLKVYYDDNDENTGFSIFKKVKKKTPNVRLSEFAVWAIENNIRCPQEIIDKAPANLKRTDKPIVAAEENTPVAELSTVPSEPKQSSVLDNSVYEDVISDETILKLMELPLPKMKQQLAILAAEKKKTDAAIMAAAKIGFMFYEEGLPKPTTEKLFVSEYKKYLDKLPELPETTIKRIYKNLPEGYRASRDGGKVASEQTDLTPIIKAAVYAGSIYDTDDVKKLSKLKAELEENEYDLPSDDVLNKIIEAVKDI
ncbi:MAG: hypothetical protein IPQ16_12030 [Geobacteraceae bacterium]|nr:hypothetical protein [Geobacteraceae bacterium]